MKNLSLLSSLNRVEVPYVAVTIGDYVFGKYTQGYDAKTGKFKRIYPNYIQSLVIKKINGRVNQYTLTLSYPITENDDPNFFEKVFSSVSKTRKIMFTYGDVSAPNFVYKDEEAIITKVTQKMSVSTAVIQYVVSAVSSAYLTTAGSFTFKEREEKPSAVIRELLYNKYYGLLDIFPGMKDEGAVEPNNLIRSDDRKVRIEMKSNINILDYLLYLVSIMKPYTSAYNSLNENSAYVLTIVDHTTSVYDDIDKNTYIFDGPYFKIDRCDKDVDQGDVYVIDIGFPSQNIITSFEITNNETYSILYDYSNRIQASEYAYRIGDDGKIEQEYAPVLSSGNDNYKTREEDKSWWTNVTQFPIKATITLKGLLRPAILMSYVRLNVYYYGKKHTSSGLYIITSQTDEIGLSGYRTTLELVRVGGDNSFSDN